jgi:hypothetical protein
VLAKKMRARLTIMASSVLNTRFELVLLIIQISNKKSIYHGEKNGDCYYQPRRIN